MAWSNRAKIPTRRKKTLIERAYTLGEQFGVQVCVKMKQDRIKRSRLLEHPGNLKEIPRARIVTLFAVKQRKV